MSLYRLKSRHSNRHLLRKGLLRIDGLPQIPEHRELTSVRRSISYITSGSRGWARYCSDEGDLFVSKRQPRPRFRWSSAKTIDLLEIPRTQPASIGAFKLHKLPPPQRLPSSRCISSAHLNPKLSWPVSRGHFRYSPKTFGYKSGLVN